MHEAARGLNENLPQRVDELIDRHCSEEEFLRLLSGLCAGARDGAWTVLARIDQNYRRGKLSVERFRMARLSIEKRMLGSNDARAAAVTVPAPTVPADARSFSAARRDAPRRWRVAVIVLIVAAFVAALLAQMLRANRPAAAMRAVDAAPSIVVVQAPAAPLPAPRIGLDSDRVVVQPGQAVAEVAVVRTGDSSAEMRIPWWTESGGARAGEDFSARGRRILVIAAGEQRASLRVPILRNRQRRYIQMFYVRLGKPEGAELDVRSSATVFIVPR
jgi:Calx-beta domain